LTTIIWIQSSLVPFSNLKLVLAFELGFSLPEMLEHLEQVKALVHNQAPFSRLDQLEVIQMVLLSMPMENLAIQVSLQEVWKRG
jgi:hypothetical protein